MPCLPIIYLTEITDVVMKMNPFGVINENSAEKSYNVHEAAEKLVCALISSGETVSTAESCTGGLIGGAITSVSGASAVFEQGFITYANSAKEKLLGVSRETLETLGAVSPDTAFQMAEGVCRASGSHIGIAVTGIAGPGGGTPEKPVGLVYISVCYKGKTHVFECHFSGDRNAVRTATVFTALTLAYKTISDEQEDI